VRLTDRKLLLTSRRFETRVLGFRSKCLDFHMSGLTTAPRPHIPNKETVMPTIYYLAWSCSWKRQSKHAAYLQPFLMQT
jgi:hypothetical protein